MAETRPPVSAWPTARIHSGDRYTLATLVPRLVLVSTSDPELLAPLSRAADQLGVSLVTLNGDRLLERARASAPDLVLLDFDRGEALDTLSLLKSGPRTLALEIGADAYLVKPLGPDFLAKATALLGGVAVRPTPR